jgi:putative DNA primase/helicase
MMTTARNRVAPEGNPLLDAALAYAAHGWAIHPLRPGDKRPILKDWPNKATSDPATISDWWQRWPAANIGLACGPSGLVVVDLDVKGQANGVQSWAALGIAGDTAASKTPSGGRHLLFAQQNGTKIPNSASKLGPGIDVRGEGGYIVLPPSTVPDGAYSWEVEPERKTPALLPLALAALLKEPDPVPRPAPAPVSNAGGYALAALQGEIDKLRAAPVGERNEALNRAAFALGQLAGAGLLDRADIETRLEAAARAKGLGQHEAQATIRSGLDAGAKSPRQVPDLQAPPATPAPPMADRSAKSRLKRPRTDLGNAERLIDRYGRNLRYCHPWDRWLAWDGKRWAVDDTARVTRAAFRTVRSIYAEASREADDEKRKGIAKWGRASEGATRIREMIRLAAALDGIPVVPDDLDANPWLLTVNNGTVDLTTGELREAAPADLLTKLAPVDYDPTAQAPTWERFLDEIMAGDRDMIAFLRRAVGYALTGDTREQVIFILFGSGANGKSTFLETLACLFGDYASKTPTETLLTRRSGSIPNDVARLRGARLVTAIEAEEGQRLAESMVKQMTGGDTITARFLRQEWFEFQPEFKLFLATNHKPQIRGTDNAIWRRIRLIPFEVSFPDDLQDKELGRKLQAELPGILAWAVRGCLEWQAAGLGVPAKVVRATADYQSEMDALAVFIDDCCLVKPTAQAKVASLYSEYETWCSVNGERPLSKRSFGIRLGERGFTQGRTGQARYWRGIGLMSDPEQLDLIDADQGRDFLEF